MLHCYSLTRGWLSTHVTVQCTQVGTVNAFLPVMAPRRLGYRVEEPSYTYVLCGIHIKFAGKFTGRKMNGIPHGASAPFSPVGLKDPLSNMISHNFMVLFRFMY